MKVDYVEIIETYNEYIQKVSKGCIFIARELQKNNKEALKDIIDFSEGLDWLVTVSNSLEEKGVKTQLNEHNLISFLEEINNAILRDDLLLVADLFEYEIAEYFKNPVLIEVDKNVIK